MSRRANPTLIGSFVLGAVLLAVLGAALFSSDHLFARKFKAVMYFTGNVAGLNVGAPVNFRGVRVGTVTSVKLISHGPKQDLLIPVEVEFDAESVVRQDGKQTADVEKALRALIGRGLRAQLNVQSFVTGLLSIELDFHPDSEVRKVGRESALLEVPTVPSKIEQISETIKALDLQGLVSAVTQVVNDVRSITGSKDTKAAIKAASSTLKAVERLALKIESEIAPMTTELRATVAAARKAAEEAGKSFEKLSALAGSLDKLAGTANQEVPASAKQFRAMTKAIEKSFARASGAVAKIDSLVDVRSDVRQEFTNMMRELAAAARSIRALSEYLERHPEALVRGKGNQGGRR
jgi:paraquat-inducible protein B